MVKQLELPVAASIVLKQNFNHSIGQSQNLCLSVAVLLTESEFPLVLNFHNENLLKIKKMRMFNNFISLLGF